MANILYQNRGNLSIAQFNRIKHLLPKQKSTGRPPLDNYLTLNTIFWIMRTSVPCRDLPPDYGNWNSVYHKFRKWCEQDIFINILRELNSGKSVLIEMDSTHCKVHQNASGARKFYGNQAFLTKLILKSNIHSIKKCISRGISLSAFSIK